MRKNWMKTYGWWIGGAGALIVLLLVFANRGDSPDPAQESYLTPASSLRDAHGLAVDVADSSKLWIASHTGLYLLKDGRELFHVGGGRDDYMGFSTHPTDPQTFYTSGHPLGGGNLGFQVSRDAGRTWTKVADGAGRGRADFHAMAVGRVDPGVIYGWYRGALQRSRDGGKSWEMVKTDLGERQVIALATGTEEKDTVYAATTAGLMVSRDQGSTWQPVSDSLAGEVVTALSVGPRESQRLMVFAQNRGLLRSTDDGHSWEALDGYPGGLALHMAIDPRNADTAYVIDQSLNIYKTGDGGATWSLIRKGGN